MTRYDPISIWGVDMGDLYGRSDINEISIGISIWSMVCRFGIRYIDMVIYHIDIVILDIDMGYLVTLELETGSCVRPCAARDGRAVPGGRGFNSPTSQLNLRRFG